MLKREHFEGEVILQNEKKKIPHLYCSTVVSRSISPKVLSCWAPLLSPRVIHISMTPNL